MNLADIVFQAGAHFYRKPLFRFDSKDYAFESIRDQVERLGRVLAGRGVKRGDRVVLVAKNKPEWVITALAVLRLGAVVVPVNPALTASEIGYIVEHSAPAQLIVDADLTGIAGNYPRSAIIECTQSGFNAWDSLVAESGRRIPGVDCEADEPAFIFYTSGTTGRPKGVLLAHRALISITDIVCDNFQIGLDDRSLIPNSLSFIYPLMINCLSCIRSGATVVLQDRFHPELAMRAVEQERITILMGVPTMFTMMLNWANGKQVDASSLRTCISAGSSLSWELAKRFKERFHVSLYDLWGQTEGTPITAYRPAAEPEGRPESCGRALPRCAVRIVGKNGDDLPSDTVGEVLLSGPNMMSGYYRNPEATAETLRNGWIYTGDLGKLDADGYLYIVGRKRDMIIRGGANIYPVEIEEVLHGHPAVMECAVVGKPDDIFGESVSAFTVLRTGASASRDELQAHCRERLAEYKVPTDITFVDELPKGPTGKILKRLLSAKA